MSASRQKRAKRRSIAAVVPKSATLAHVGFEGARHMQPERIPTSKRERTVSLRLFDVTDETIENIGGYSGAVKRLMIPGLKLSNISESLIQKMLLLEKIDLGDNQLSDGSLPDSFKVLEHLVEVNLNDNKFTRLPTGIKRLRNLTRLNVSNNAIDNLKGVDKLKKMQILMVDNNNITSVFKEICHMRRLEILDCSHNNVREVGLDIKNLSNLKMLDISKNKITVLPADVFLLPRLQSLKASHNQISKIPIFSMNPQHTRRVSEVDLSGNAISRFPGHLIVMSKKLDLASNRIKTLDWKHMKKVEGRPDQKLFVDGNPLAYPPMDICECGLRSMMQFFQETQAVTKVYQGVKMFVLGATDSGKTSFVQTFVDGQSRLSSDMYEKSAGIETTDTTLDNMFDEPVRGDVTFAGSRRTSAASSTTTQPSKPLQLCIWDFCGHPFYLFPHYVFFEQPAIAVLTFNMHTYTSDTFEEKISSWFDWMIAKTNKLIVLLVGTHSDKLRKDRITDVCNEVKSKLSAHADKQRQIVQKRINIITEKPHISQTLSSQLNSLSSLLQEKFKVQSEVIVTSAAKNTGYKVVRASIELLANDAKQFPNVLRKIPTFWLDIENYAEDKGNSMLVPVMEFDAFKEEIGAKFGMRHLIVTIVQYLHETGKIIWFSNMPALKNYIFLRPAWLFELKRCIFRHDLKEKLDVEIEDYYRTIGLSQSGYEDMREEFLAEGIADKDLLKCMLSGILPLETNGPFYEVVDLLMNKFDIGYPVSKRLREHAYSFDPEEEGAHNRMYLLPWFRNVPEPESISEVWEPLQNRRKLAGVYRFPRYMPPGLFEMLSVRTHREKHKLSFLAHWSNGFHAKHKEENVQVLFSYTKHDDDGGTTLRFEMRDAGDPKVDEVAAASMWSILLPVLMDFEELLHTYTGVLVERLMECPECHELSFLGEWMSPKETQSMGVRPCEECMQDIDTAFLVQPREKKRDDVRLNLAMMRRRRRDALSSSITPANLNVVSGPVRQGRRAAVMPTDQLLFQRPSITSTTSTQDDDATVTDDAASANPRSVSKDIESFLASLRRRKSSLRLGSSDNEEYDGTDDDKRDDDDANRENDVVNDGVNDVVNCGDSDVGNCGDDGPFERRRGSHNPPALPRPSRQRRTFFHYTEEESENEIQSDDGD